MDGPRAQWLAGVDIPALASLLVRYESHCYRAVPRPDLLIVLRLEPELAVKRKFGVDPAEFVRARSAEVYAREWTDGRAHVVDASRSRAEVAVAIRRAVWASLV
jgi:thymidylate kinase